MIYAPPQNMEDAANNTEDQPRGLRCPKCGCCDLRVKYTRHFPETRRRVRICRNCRCKVRTKEVITGSTDDPKKD